MLRKGGLESGRLASQGSGAAHAQGPVGLSRQQLLKAWLLWTWLSIRRKGEAGTDTGGAPRAPRCCGFGEHRMTFWFKVMRGQLLSAGLRFENPLVARSE